MKIILIFTGWQIPGIDASHDWNTMVEIRQNKFGRDSRRDGQVAEIGKETVESYFVVKNIHTYYCLSR